MSKQEQPRLTSSCKGYVFVSRWVFLFIKSSTWFNHLNGLNPSDWIWWPVRRRFPQPFFFSSHNVHTVQPKKLPSDWTSGKRGLTLRYATFRTRYQGNSISGHFRGNSQGTCISLFPITSGSTRRTCRPCLFKANHIGRALVHHPFGNRTRVWCHTQRDPVSISAMFHPSPPSVLA